jgi:phosphopantetheine adenylyltransferase
MVRELFHLGKDISKYVDDEVLRRTNEKKKVL